MRRPAWFTGSGLSARRGERGAFAADWLLVIAAVMSLGGLSAYLVEGYVESLTEERNAEQRNDDAYLDDGRTVNINHSVVRNAAAAAEAIVNEAVSVSGDDPRFGTWGDWARYFDAKCRRLRLNYSHVQNFTVFSLFLPPLRDQKSRSPGSKWLLPDGNESDHPGRASDPFDAAGLAAADTTPYATDGFQYPRDQLRNPTAAYLLLLSNRTKILSGHWELFKDMILGGPTYVNAWHSVFKGAVAWCFLPRSVSATLADGTTLDKQNPLLLAAVAHAEGVAENAARDDPERPGDKDSPPTWQNWQDYWTARCLETLDVFSALRGFKVTAEFTRPEGKDANSRIGSVGDLLPIGKAPRKGTAKCVVEPA